MRRFAGDIFALGVILTLCVVFYYPQQKPLESRYTYYADVFERAAVVVNPSYNDEYNRYGYEKISPLMTGLAGCALRMWPEDRATAVLALHLGIVLSACVMAYAANRCFFSILPASYITILLFLDRSLMPVARGLGVTYVLLLAPLFLFMMFGLAKTQDRKSPLHRRLSAALLFALSGGVIYSIGGHETLYAIPAFAAFIVLVALAWLIRSIRSRKLGRPPSWVSATAVLGACAVGVGIIAAIHSGIAEQQKPYPLKDLLKHRAFLARAMTDVETETDGEDDLKLCLKQTFIDGDYAGRRSYGARHANTFLYPGPGFNGMIPIFVLPGFLIGFCVFVRRSLGLLHPDADQSADWPQRYFLLLNAVLLCMFVAVMFTTKDPKPTRYTPCIYPIFALSAMGYMKLCTFVSSVAAKRVKPKFDELGRPKQTVGVACAVVLTLILATTMALRLHKNYKDLHLYLDHYAMQISHQGLPEQLERAQTEFASKQVIFVTGRWTLPAVGLITGYESFPNITFIKTRYARRSAIPKDAVVFFHINQEWRLGCAEDCRE